MDRADDPDFEKRSYSSSELRTAAQIFSDMYFNLSKINADKSAQTVTLEGISLWEKDFFIEAQDSSLSFQSRKQNLIAKIRANGGISLPAIRDILSAILTPLGLSFDILPYSGQFNGSIYGGWIFEQSQLDLDTFLSFLDPLIGAQLNHTALDCNLDYVAAGLTQQEMIEIQQTAYTYEVRIFGNASTVTLNLIDKQLTALEPARSTHVIRNNAIGAIL